MNHRRFQVFTRPPETSESCLHLLKRQNFECTTSTYEQFLVFLQLSTYLLRKQAATAAAEDVNRREEAERKRKGREGEEEEKGFISNSGRRPRHAEENTQSWSLSCPNKKSLMFFFKFPTL